MASKSEEMTWMYEGTKALVNREDYLLGKKVDKNLELYSDAVNQEKEGGIAALPSRPLTSTGGQARPNSPRITTVLNLDIVRNEDPLVAIKVKEDRVRRDILENPIRMKKLQNLVKEAFEKKVKKAFKKEMKKKKKKKRKHSHNNSSESDSRYENERDRSKSYRQRVGRHVRRSSELRPHSPRFRPHSRSPKLRPHSRSLKPRSESQRQRCRSPRRRQSPPASTSYHRGNTLHSCPRRRHDFPVSARSPIRRRSRSVDEKTEKRVNRSRSASLQSDDGSPPRQRKFAGSPLGNRQRSRSADRRQKDTRRTDRSQSRSPSCSDSDD